MADPSSRTKAERFAYIKYDESGFSARWLCKVLDVSPQGYYKWLKRTERKRLKENITLAQLIEGIFSENDGNYGSPRITTELQKRGHKINHKRVERIMREMGLVGKAAVLYRRKAIKERFFMKFPNLKLDEPAPTNVNQQWAGDITYLKVQGQWCYLAVVMDLFSRNIIGWALGKKRDAELTRAALMKAMSYRDTTGGLLFHSDRGQEYGAVLFQQSLTDAGIRPSMNRADSLTDNIHVESFFRTLKTECYHGLVYKNEHELRMALSGYLDSYYNVKRIHTSIGDMSPLEFEQQVA